MRRVIIIFIFVALLAGGYLLYKKYNSSSSTITTPSSKDFKTFFPVGETTPVAPNTSLSASTPGVNTTVLDQAKFTEISTHSVAGYTAFTDVYTISVPGNDPKKPIKQTVSDTVVRYISRVSGYVYEKRNSDQPVQITNIYIPNIYEGFIAGQSAILRFLRDDDETIATYVVPMPPKNPDGTRTQKEGFFLQDAITALISSPDQTELARVYASGGIASILTSDMTDKNKKELISSPFTEWLLQWADKNTLYAQTKASGLAEGFLYKIDRTERKLRRVLGNNMGLTTSVSPSGTYILYSESTEKTISTKLLNTKTNKTVTLNLKLLPEKCAWTTSEDLVCAGNNTIPSGIYPDSWYQGLVHFQDELYHIYTSSNTFDVLYDGNGKSFDMTNLQLNQNSLYFIDKQTGLLWQFNL